MSPWLVFNNMLVLLLLLLFVCGRGRDACDRSCRISWMYRQKSNQNTFFSWLLLLIILHLLHILVS